MGIFLKREVLPNSGNANFATGFPARSPLVVIADRIYRNIGCQFRLHFLENTARLKLRNAYFGNLRICPYVFLSAAQITLSCVPCHRANFELNSSARTFRRRRNPPLGQHPDIRPKSHDLPNVPPILYRFAGLQYLQILSHLGKNSPS